VQKGRGGKPLGELKKYSINFKEITKEGTEKQNGRERKKMNTKTIDVNPTTPIISLNINGLIPLLKGRSYQVRFLKIKKLGWGYG
jgi:hypothetical protein